MSQGFMKGIVPSSFMSTPQEFHAFVHGFCEILCPWPPLRHYMSDEKYTELKAEYHYYTFGRAVGVIAWLIIAKIIQEIFF